jgi:putative ABC transport system permease protein
MRLGGLAYFYRRRLRAHGFQELLAGIGIAVAVALVFAASVAQSSITVSASEVIHAVAGPASLQLRARGNEGFGEGMLARVQALAGVKQAAPLLEATATVRASNGRRSTIDLAGTGASLAILNGLAHTLPIATLSPGGIGLSASAAQTLGIPSQPVAGSDTQAGQRVTLELRGHAYPLRVSAVLGPEAVGALSRASVGVMPLQAMQQLAGLQSQITRILVQTKPGQQAAVRGELQRLAGDRLTVARADQDLALLRQALGPSDLASGLFAAIGALLGFLFVFNAMLLTAPERRQSIAELRIAGARRKAIVEMVLFQAVCLGLTASLVGLLAGYALSVGVFHLSSGYLAGAFPLGGGTVIPARAVLLSLLGGILATCIASTVPLLDLRRGRPRDAVYRESGVPGNTLRGLPQRRLLAATIALVALASALFAALPAAAIIATAVLALATVLAVPLVLAGLLGAAQVLVERRESLTTLSVALRSLRAATVRSLALAATGAVALFGSVALGGSRQDLLHGIRMVAHNYASDASVWVTSPRDNQATVEFPRRDYVARLQAVPGVAAVRTFQGSFADVGKRRPWIIARPGDAGPGILRGQMIAGSAEHALARMRQGGWIAVSEQIAEEQNTPVGQALILPTPTGDARLRVAAITTNFAWPTGVIFMGTADYARLWDTTAPSALGIELAAGADAARVQGALARALGPGSGLEVSSASARQAKIESSAGEGLGQLREIATLLLLAAIVAMAAALTSSIRARRVSLAGLRLSGVRPARLRRILLLEAALMLGAGCVTGSLAGIYGQVIIDGYLKGVTGFPVASVTVSARPVEVLAFVLAGTLALVAIPGWLGSRVSPTLALEHE